MRTHGSAQQLEQRRRWAVELLQEGYTPEEVAGQVGADPSSVRRWQRAYRRRGPAALAAKPHPGKPCRLTAQQRRGLVRRLLAGARAQGFATQLWTCPRIVQLIERCYRVTYHVDHIPRLMRSLGFSPQKPQRRAVERDEAAITHWVKHDWSRIKKKRRG